MCLGRPTGHSLNPERLGPNGCLNRQTDTLPWSHGVGAGPAPLRAPPAVVHTAPHPPTSFWYLPALHFLLISSTRFTRLDLPKNQGGIGCIFCFL